MLLRLKLRLIWVMAAGNPAGCAACGTYLEFCSRDFREVVHYV